IREGKQFLNAFPDFPGRVAVGLLVADAFARASNNAEEFAIYDTLLHDLGTQAGGVPIGAQPTGGRPSGAVKSPCPSPQQPRGSRKRTAGRQDEDDSAEGQ